MSYRRSPTLSAVLRDLEDTERHRRCEGYVWKYDAGTFECDSCGLRRRAIEQTVYTAVARNERDNSRIIGGPASVLIPPGSGRSRTRGMRP